jgi:lysozyme
VTRRIAPEALEKLKRWEGFVAFAYDDADGPRTRRLVQPGQHVRGTLTIGYGHTATVRPGQTITQEQGEQLLRDDLARFERAVDSLVKVPLTNNQFGALVSFAFNVGEGAFRNSTLLRKLNAGEYDAVTAELAKWNKTTISGKRVVSPGLVNRRAAEAGLWVAGDFVSSASVEAAPPPAAPAPTIDAAALGAIATAAATGAPALTALGGIPPIVGAVLVGGLVVLAAIVLLTRQRRA